MLRKEREKGGADSGEIRGFLGEGTRFKGVLSFTGTIRIDGHVEGEIVGEDLLIIGEPARVEAEVEVGVVIVSGRLMGSVQARKRVELLAPAEVHGTIRTPCLIVAEGAVFNGTCEMDRHEEGKVVRLEATKDEGRQGAPDA